MKNFSNVFKIILTLLLVILVIILFKYFHLRHYLSIEGFNDYSDQIVQIRADHPYYFIIAYFLVYFVLIVCCVPGTIILDIVAGFLFGVAWGTALIVISYGISTCGNYFVVHYLFHDFFIKRAKKFKLHMLGRTQRQSFITLTVLRLIPIIPFWALNILASVLKVRFRLFILSTIIGILPIAIIYAMVGDGTRNTILSHKMLDINLLMNPEIWLPLIILAVIMMFPSIIKFIINRNMRKKGIIPPEKRS